MHLPQRVLLLLAALTLAALPAQNLKEVEKRVTEFTLPNGMQFIVLERHEAPVGGVQYVRQRRCGRRSRGQSGMAHMFEHMIGKGTTSSAPRIGKPSRKALERVETLYDRLEGGASKGLPQRQGEVEAA